MVAVVRYATTLKKAMNVHVTMAMHYIVMEKVVQVRIKSAFNSKIQSCILFIYQILMNVLTIKMAVVRFATTLKEAMNVHVTLAMYYIVMEKVVQVKIKSAFNSKMQSCVLSTRY